MQDLFILNISDCMSACSTVVLPSHAQQRLNKSRTVVEDVTRKVAQKEPYMSLGFSPDSLQLWHHKLHTFQYLSETSCHKYTQTEVSPHLDDLHILSICQTHQHCVTSNCFSECHITGMWALYQTPWIAVCINFCQTHTSAFCKLHQNGTVDRKPSMDRGVEGVFFHPCPSGWSKFQNQAVTTKSFLSFTKGRKVGFLLASNACSLQTALAPH